MTGGREGGGGKGSDPRDMRPHLQFLHLGTLIAVALVLGLYAGNWLDERTGWAPVFTLAGTVLGISLGMAAVIREVGKGDK